MNVLPSGLMQANEFAFDIETGKNLEAKGWPKDLQGKFGLSYSGEVKCIAFAWMQAGKLQSAVYGVPYPEGFEDDVRELLNSGRQIIAHNAVFDLRAVAGRLNKGKIKGNVWDTMVMARLLHPLKQWVGNFYSFSMINVAKTLGVQLTPHQLAMKDERDDIDKIPLDLVMTYCKEDAEATLRIYNEQIKLVNSTQLYDLTDMEVRAMRQYCQMAATGFRVDREEIQRRLEKLQDVIADAVQKLEEDGLSAPNKKGNLGKYIYIRKGIPIPEFSPFSAHYTKKARETVASYLKLYRQVTLRIDNPEATHMIETGIFASEKDIRHYKQRYGSENVLIGYEDGIGSRTVLKLRDCEDVRYLSVQQLKGELPDDAIIPAGENRDNIDYYMTTDRLSVSAKVLKEYIGMGLPEDDDFDDGEDGAALYAERLSALSHWITCTRMISTLKGLLLHSATDGRIHSLVTIATHTGRRSAKHPQVQNWNLKGKKNDPAGGLAGIAIADAGCTLVEIDQSNAENRIAAMLAMDDAFAEACVGGDFHAACALMYFGEEFRRLNPENPLVKPTDPTAAAEWDRLRNMGKTITFGTAYGMGLRSLAYRLSISNDKAAQILEAKRKAFAEVAETKKKLANLVKQRSREEGDGWIKLWTGRLVPVEAYRADRSWNYVCQGGVGEIIKRALVFIMEEFEIEGMRSRVALDMHDALIVSIDHREWEKAIAIVSRHMESIIPEAYNERTTPKMVWIAKPDLKANAHKWGEGQAHPGDEQFGADYTDEPTPVLPLAIGMGADEEVKPVQLGMFDNADTAQPQAEWKNFIEWPIYSPELINATLDIAFPHEKPLHEWTKKEIAAGIKYYSQVHEACMVRLEDTVYSVQIPVTEANEIWSGAGSISLLKTTVKFSEWWKIPLLWSEVAKFSEYQQAYNLDGNELRRVSAERRQMYDDVKMISEDCMAKFDALLEFDIAQAEQAAQLSNEAEAA